MLRPGKGTNGALPDYSASATAIPSGNGQGGYGNAMNSSNAYHSSVNYGNGNANYSRGEFSRQYEDTFKDKHVRSKKPDVARFVLKFAKDPMAWASIAVALVFLLTVHYRGQRNWVLRSFHAPNVKDVLKIFRDTETRLTNCRDDVHRLKKSDYELHTKITNLQGQITGVKAERDMIEKKLVDRKDHVVHAEHKEHIETLTARDYAWKEQVEVLQNATQRESKRSAAELFGRGPHHVKFTVVLPSDEHEHEQHFILEMAPLDVMPHAVHVFLQQVVHGLWNDAWFYLNGPHVLQGGPQAPEDEEELWHLEHGEDGDRAVALKGFREANLETLAFPEYSDKFEHNKWTVGFTGRPGGPDFYINKMDNTHVHGPGGQYQHDLHEFGDPCFAKVVDGFKVLESMFKEPTYPDDNEWAWFFEDPVHIVHAKLLEDAPLKVELAKEPTDHSRKPDKPLKRYHFDHHVTP